MLWEKIRLDRVAHNMLESMGGFLCMLVNFIDANILVYLKSGSGQKVGPRLKIEYEPSKEIAT